MSIHPDHYFPNSAPRGYHMIDSTCRLMKGDVCWDMSEDTWGPIDPAHIGTVHRTYIRLARPNSNSLVARARRDGVTKWRSLRTAKHCMPVILRLKSGRIVMGRKLSLDYPSTRHGWYQDRIDFWTTNKRIYPTAWSELPER